MTLQDDLEAKRPGEWTQDDIDSLKHKYTRTHFDHFPGVDTSHFKVWVLIGCRVVQVTKARAQRKGYKIISGSRKRPRSAEVKNGC